MFGTVRSSPDDIREAVLALSRCIAGRDDLETLLSGVAQSLRRVVDFEYLGLMVYEHEGNRMRLHALGSAGPLDTEEVVLPIEEDPSGWVWANQQPLVVSHIEEETRWPGFMSWALRAKLHALILVPLTAGPNRLGAIGFGCLTPFMPSAAELSFLERVASEFAVAVDAHLAKRQLIHERDRIRALFDITNALVSNLSPDKLVSAISEQLSRVVRHDIAVLTLCNDSTGGLDLYALHFPGEELFKLDRTSGTPQGMPAAEALATGKPVVIQQIDFERFPSPDYRKIASLGFKSHCSLPLITPNRQLGTLDVARTSGERWTDDDVHLLVQVARQIAIELLQIAQLLLQCYSVEAAEQREAAAGWIEGTHTRHSTRARSGRQLSWNRK
jgi:GAF domain-containing protein